MPEKDRKQSCFTRLIKGMKKKLKERIVLSLLPYCPNEEIQRKVISFVIKIIKKVFSFW